MPSSSSAPQTSPASADWLRSHAGRAIVCLAIVGVVAKGFALTEPDPLPRDDAALAVLVVVSILLSLIISGRIVRDRSIHPGLRRACRLKMTAALLFGVCAAAAGAAGYVSETLRPTLRLVASLGSLPALLLILWATVKFPAGEISRRHLAPAILDLGTLLLSGLLAFWIFALSPALHGHLSADTPGFPWPLLTITAYAFVSLLLLSMVLLMPFRAHEPDAPRGIGYIAAACVAVVAAEVMPLCAGFASDRADAHPWFLGWVLFSLAFAVHARRARNRPNEKTDVFAQNLHFAVPFASIGLVAILGFVAIFERDLWNEHIEVLLPAVFAAFILVIVRQTVIARENFGMALEMQRAKEVAESANSARLHFLANISHDLRTPLNGVLGCAQILLREKAFSSKNRELLKTIQGCAEHLRNLINDLLDLSKLEADRLELAPSPFDLKPFLKALMKTFELEAENKGIVLELDEAPNLPDWVKCDRKRLQQILGNLVHNAIKFTDHGRVKLRARVAGPAMIFEVIDTGCGIMPDKIGELFRPFYVVDERSIKLEGTGLGLSISKKLANKMDGDIFVNSTLGKGSTFSVVIPLVLASPVVEVERTVVDYQGRRRRILIVDDNPANRVVLRTMLEPLDFLIHEAGDAAAAHEEIRLAHPDIILMDLMMPGTDGFTLCRQVVDLDLLKMPVLIAVSAMAGDDVLERCRKAGFADLLNKPVHLESLVEVLRAHAGIEWTYGILQTAPIGVETTGPETIVPPPAEEISVFLDLARRGVVRNIESRAEQLARDHPEYSPFARRVARYARDFKLKELGEWLSALPTQHAHGPA